MSEIWQSVLIKRSLSSKIPFHTGKTIGSAIPPALSMQVNASFYSAELRQYIEWSHQISKHLIIRLSNGKLGFNMAYHRELILITTWLWFRYVGGSVMGENGKNLDQQLQRGALAEGWIVTAMKKENQVFEERKELCRRYHKEDPSLDQQPWEIPSNPRDISDADTLVYLLQGSSKLRELLPRIQEEVLRKREKSIVCCVNPAQQFFVGAALRLAGIDAHVYHADLDANDREKLLHQLNNKEGAYTVLICSCYVGSAGSNLQRLCRNSHQFDVPMSESIRMQAIGRIHRLGQSKIVKVYDYVVDHSFNVRQIAKNIKKAIPGMAAQLSPEFFYDRLNSSTGEVELGHWVSNLDGSISRVSAELFQKIPEQRHLDANELVPNILGVARGARVIRDKSDWEEQV